jgi:hypothetical protein
MGLMMHREFVEMLSWRSARYVGWSLALSLLCWWTASINPFASGLFLWAVFWTCMSWLVRDRDSQD